MSPYKGEDYILLTRIKRGDDLVQTGTLRATSDELARVYAKQIYDEEDWVEMQLVKQSDLIPTRLPKGLFDKKGVV